MAFVMFYFCAFLLQLLVQMDHFSSLYIVYYLSKISGTLTYTTMKNNDNRMYKSSRVLIFYSIFMLSVKLIIMLYLYMDKFYPAEKDQGMNVIFLFQITSVLILMLVILISMSYYSAKHANIHNKICEIDRMLNLLGIFINHSSALKFSIKIIIFEVISAIIIAFISIGYTYELNIAKTETIYYFVCNFSVIYLSLLVLLQFKILLFITRERLLALNMNLSEVINIKSTQFKNVHLHVKNTLTSTSVLVKKICLVIKETNQVFSLILLMFITTAFIVVLTHSYKLCQIISEVFCESKLPALVSAVGAVFWIVYIVTNIYVIAVLCTNLQLDVERLKGTLCKINLVCDYPDIKREVMNLSIQLLHNDVKIYAFGFFIVDNSLIYNIAGAVTTYLVILLQFYFNNPTKNVLMFDPPKYNNSYLVIF